MQDWLTADQVNGAITKLRSTATGGNSEAFELAVTEAFGLLGFVARHVGGNAAPDAVLDAPLGVRSYRVIVECKTASLGGIVANPRPEEPARFRDSHVAKCALHRPAIGDDVALDPELRQQVSACGRLRSRGRAGASVWPG